MFGAVRNCSELFGIGPEMAQRLAPIRIGAVPELAQNWPQSGLELAQNWPTRQAQRSWARNGPKRQAQNWPKAAGPELFETVRAGPNQVCNWKQIFIKQSAKYLRICCWKKFQTLFGLAFYKEPRFLIMKKPYRPTARKGKKYRYFQSLRTFPNHC